MRIPFSTISGFMYDAIIYSLPAHPASSASKTTKSIEWCGEKQLADVKTLADSNKAATPEPLSLKPPVDPYVSQ